MSFNKAKILKSAEKYVQQGKIAAAIEEYRKIVEADNNDLTMINTLGDLCVRAGRTEEAIQNFSRIAESYRENGFTLKAIAMYKKINKLEPSNYETSLKLADLYSKQGLIVDARQQYLIVADAYKRNGQTKRALEVLQKIADLDPENTSVRLKLAESYHLEGLNDEAHEAYIYAGQEFLKKNKAPEGVQAYQKALSINPDSKPALKSLADAYIQQNDLQRAFDMLLQALEKNPGDTDLIVILGRTYLTARMLDEAEVTFSRLLELDKSRYDYLIEVGRRFLETGQFERTITVVDKCIDLLIARRQEEKAITLLKGVLDYDANHMQALKRLADIYTRVREDHNLVTTLNMVVEAALRLQQKPEAIEALKHLVEIEPDEPSHRQRLASLGGIQAPPVAQNFSIPPVFDTPAPPSSYQTIPLKQPAQSDAGVAEKQLREAEMFASRGYADHAAELLEELVNQHPDYIEARLKLKQLFIDGGLEHKAAAQCVELARLYEAKGDTAFANDLLSEAYELNPSLGNVPAQPQSQRPAAAAKSNNGPANNSFSDGSVEIDLNGSLTDMSLEALSYQPQPEPMPFQSQEQASYQQPYQQPGGFMPPDLFAQAASNPTPAMPEPAQPPPSFEALFGNDTTPATPTSAVPPIHITNKGATAEIGQSSFEININDDVSSPTTQLAKDKILKDELEGVDFYIAQGYMEIARDTLENLDKQYPNNAAIGQRFAQLGIERAAPSSFNFSQQTAELNIEPIEELPMQAFIDQPANSSGMPDIFGNNAAQTPKPLPEPPPPASMPLPVISKAQPEAAGSLFDSLVTDIEQTLDEMPTIDMIPMASTTKQQQPPQPQSAPPQSAPEPDGGLEAGLLSIFEEFKSGFEQSEKPDFETHYNLGLAYKDMELFDDAIEEFQVACKATSPTAGDGYYFNCCNMLGFCFLKNNMARPSAVWYKRGLDSPGRSEEEYQAMRFDLAVAYEQLGEFDKSLEYFQEVYAIDINYRDVASKIRDLQERVKSSQ